jgi:nitrilase
VVKIPIRWRDTPSWRRPRKYPPLWPTRDPAGGGKPYDLEAAIRVRAGAHSFEAKVFNLVVSSVLDETTRTALSVLGDDAMRVLESTARGVTLVIDPFAEVISDVLKEDEGILLQEIDLAQCVEPKQFHDVSGYYNRFDIFDLKVNRSRVAPITFSEEPSSLMGEPLAEAEFERMGGK